MAINIDSFGNLSKVEPTGSDYFNVDMLERIVGGWPEPCKIGPIWLIKNEDSEKIFENYNQVASMFFQLPIYGDVMALSALELPPEWDLIDDVDKKYSVEDIDEGFLKSLSDLTLSTDNIFDNEGNVISDKDKGFDTWGDYNLTNYPPDSATDKDYFGHNTPYEKNEYFYNPNKPKHPETSHENYESFLRDAYNFIVDSSKDDFNEFIVYEDDSNVVKVNKEDDRVKTIDQILKLLIEDEDYEKCAVLRDIVEKSFSESQL